MNLQELPGSLEQSWQVGAGGISRLQDLYAHARPVDHASFYPSGNNNNSRSSSSSSSHNRSVDESPTVTNS